MFPLTYLLIIVSLVAVAVVEILISYEKHQMKKQFLEEMDEQDRKRKEK